MNDINTRERIIKTAESLFFKKGYDKVSVQLITREVGIAKGTFYHHFLSKAELLNEIVNREVENQVRNLIKIKNDHNLNPIDKLNSIFSTSARWKIDQLPLIISIMEALLSDDNIIVRSKLEELTRQKSIPLFESIILEGVKKGSFNIGKMRPGDTATFIVEFSLSLMDKFSRLIIKLLENPESGEELVGTSESYRVAIERLLGIQESTLNFMVKEFVQAVHAHKIHRSKE